MTTVLQASAGHDAAQAVLTGSMVVAIPIAFAAGLLSFLSPCILPLVPGYFAYVTGLVGVDLAEARRWRMVSGALLFVLGFTAVFVSFGALFGGLGSFLLQNMAWITRVLGVFVIVFGLAFMGVIPWLNRTWKIQSRPALGLAGAFPLGLLFGLGWTPCLGPTLAAVQTLAFNEASALRGAILTAAYCLGLGLPFVLIAVAFRWAAGALAFLKRHYVFVMRLGGVMLVAVGVLMVTGWWDTLTVDLRVWAGRTGTVL